MQFAQVRLVIIIILLSHEEGVIHTFTLGSISNLINAFFSSLARRCSGGGG